MSPEEVMAVVPIADANKNLHITSDGWAGALLRGESLIELPLGSWQPIAPPYTIVRGMWLLSTWARAWSAFECPLCFVRRQGAPERNMTLVDPGDKQTIWRVSRIVAGHSAPRTWYTLDLFPIRSAPVPLLEKAYRLTWEQLAHMRHVATVRHPTSNSPVMRHLAIAETQLEAAKLALKERLQLLKEKLDATAKVD